MKWWAVWMARLALLAGLNSPALSQRRWTSETGSRIQVPAPAQIPYDSTMSKSDRAATVVRAFGVCAVMKDRRRVEATLAYPRFDPEYYKRLDALATSNCLASGSLKMPVDIMRFALYQGLYSINFAHKNPPFFNDPVDYWKDVGGQTQDPIKRDYVAMRQFGDCVAHADPANSRNLVLAAPGSDQGKAALKLLVPVLGPCIVEGARIEFSKPMLVGILAETLFRASTPAPVKVPPR